MPLQGRTSQFERWRIEPSAEGIPLVFGDGKYPHDPPRVASLLESALAAEVDRLRQGLWDCAIAAGMDHDGDLTPRHLAHPDIVELALREVRELRRDCDVAEGGGIA